MQVDPGQRVLAGVVDIAGTHAAPSISLDVHVWNWSAARYACNASICMHGLKEP